MSEPAWVPLGAGLDPAFLTDTTNANITGANTDVPWPAGVISYYINPSTAGGSIRSVGTPPDQGAIMVIRAGGGGLTLKHNLGGGTGQVLYLISLADTVLANGEAMILMYQTNFWVQVAPKVTAVPAGASLVTSLPAGPVDGQECILTDSLTAPTYTWHLRYVAAKATNKWVFVGGSPLAAEVLTSETATATTYTALATAGPSIALPVAGDYTITIEAEYINTSNATGVMSYDIGGTAANDNDSWRTQWTNGGNGSFNARTMRKAGLGAVTLVSKYKVTVGTGTWAKRRIQAVPIAIGG